MLALSLLFAAFTVAAPGSYSVVHEKRELSPQNRHTIRSERIDRDAILPVRIALRQSNLDDGYEHLMSVSDPSSKDYGKHWTIEEIHAKFAPSDETIEAVKAWLVSFGIPEDDIKESTSRGWIGVDMSAADAESLFRTEYYEQSDSDNKVEVGCDKYHVPYHLSNHIDYVTPGIHSSPFDKRTLRKRAPAEIEERALFDYKSVANCGTRIRPSCIKALYNIPDATLNQPENTLGIFEDYYDVYDQTDLNLFFRKFAPYIPQNTHPKLVSINNATAPVSVKNGGGESVVDFDLAFSLLYPQSITLYQSSPTQQEANQWATKVPGTKDNKASYVNSRSLWEVLLDAVDGSFCTKGEKSAGVECGTVELTRVLSVSYAAAELFMPEKRAKRACSEYMKLGLKGHTILFASGDYGPAVQNGCANPAHLDDPTDYNGTVFNPFFPASCPYVTSVGGTQLDANQTVNGTETTLSFPSLGGSPPYSFFGSGGGFSNYFTAPGYQKDSLNTYFDKYDPGYPSYTYAGKSSVGAKGGKYAKGGRGVPDVSANGAKLATFVMGASSGGQYGTSLATPIWASLITMINQERTKAGKGPVGFINPVLYKNTDVFNDITTGNAPGCLTRGYSAEPGWDPTTGLGTPNYPDLLKVFMDLP